MGIAKVPFDRNNIVDHHRLDDFNKIDRSDLIAVFWANNSPEGREEVERMKRHFSGQEFPNSPDVPHAVTLTRWTSNNGWTVHQFQVWVQRRA